MISIKSKQQKRGLLICIITSILSCIICIAGSHILVNEHNKWNEKAEIKEFNGVIVDIEEITDTDGLSTSYILYVELDNGEIVKVNKAGGLSENIGDEVKVYTENFDKYALHKNLVRKLSMAEYLILALIMIITFLSSVLWISYFGCRYAIIYISIWSILLYIFI